ncbi:MAG TPA: sigma-54 dependent transcriptional regulator [Verrucomicrobiae bacterium]|nr:sigma-54 dependent transcriptional regulator [Verrucomicrobiae bacterium]
MSPKTNHPSPGAARILIVDDDAGQRSLLNSFLNGQGFETVPVSSGERALEVLGEQEVAMMISDVRMPGISGLETLHRLRKLRPTLPVLLVTAYADIRDAVVAMRDGAVNYLEKPIDLDELLASVRNALGLEGAMAPKVTEDRPLPEGVVASSPLMRAVFRDTSLVASSETRILLTGESGVGKEVIAEVIHAWSRRSTGPLIKVNCAAIPETLLESELFGHEKGAFTGAYTQRIGRFEEANQGTIFLDEIVEMSPSLQAKLLRVLQDGRFQRVGSNKELHTDARILAATNRDLEEVVANGEFREDLYYRLNVMEIHVPPLRERPEDILPLATRFLAQFTNNQAKFSPGVARFLEGYKWPGNVRELRNAIERAVLMSHGDLILPEHFPARVQEDPAKSAERLTVQASRLEDLEREAILLALREHSFNRTETAKALGLSRRALLYKVHRLRELGFQVDPPAPDVKAT